MLATMAVRLLSSMRFGVEHHKEPDGKQIFLSSDGDLCCPHGEKSSTICYWLGMEKAARAEGRTPLPRGGGRTLSTCDCQNTDGLNGAVGDSVSPPTLPTSLFAYLEEQQAEQVIVRGREARRVPHLTGPTFVTTLGTLVCIHGRSRKSLVSDAKKPPLRKQQCGCTLSAMPQRCHRLGGVPLGKYERQQKSPKKAAVATIADGGGLV